MIDTICDYMEKKQNKDKIGKLLYGDISKSVKHILGLWGCNDDCWKYVEIKYPYLPKEEYMKKKKRISNQFKDIPMII